MVDVGRSPPVPAPDEAAQPSGGLALQNYAENMSGRSPTHKQKMHDRLIVTVAKYQLDCEIKSESFFSFDRSTLKSS